MMTSNPNMAAEMSKQTGMNIVTCIQLLLTIYYLLNINAEQMKAATDMMGSNGPPPGRAGSGGTDGRPPRMHAAGLAVKPGLQAVPPSPVMARASPDTFVGMHKLPHCVGVWATFTKGHYDSFVVDQESSNELIELIWKTCPGTKAKLSKRRLHMTTKYPSGGKLEIPGDTGLGSLLTGRPSPGFRGNFKIQVHITEFFISRDEHFASIPIAGIDTPFMFTPASKRVGTPDHLTLWGYPPVQAGRTLIGRKLALREPYMQETIASLQKMVRLSAEQEVRIDEREAMRIRELESQLYQRHNREGKRIRELEAKLREANRNVAKIEKRIYAFPMYMFPSLTLPIVILVQSMWRRKRAAKYVAKLRRCEWTHAQCIKYTIVLQRRWREIRRQREEIRRLQQEAQWLKYDQEDDEMYYHDYY